MSEELYAWLLKLYPAAFREEYSAAALQLFRDRLRAERGFLARCRLWFDVIFDLAVSIPREYRRPGRLAEPQPGGYRLSGEAVAAMMRGWRTSRTTLVLYFCAAVALGTGIGWLGGAPQLPLLVMYGVLTPLGIVALYREKSRFKRFWLGYELIVETDRIRQKHAGEGPEVIVFRSEVTGVIENQNGVGVLAGTRRPVIWVPSQLNGFEQVREHLAAWMPIDRPGYLHDHRSAFRMGRAVRSLIVATYVPAVLIRSLDWFLPLALVSAGYLVLSIMRRRREGQGIKTVMLPLLGLAPLIVKAITLFRVN